MSVLSTRLPFFVGFVLAFSLMGVALPYALAHGRVLPYVHRMQQLQEATARPDLPPMLAAWKSASRFFPDPKLEEGYIFLRMTAAQLDKNPAPAVWVNLAKDYNALLAKRPLDPISWARLAYVNIRADDKDAARVAMQRSFETGRYMPGFMQWRYVHALSLWDGMNEAQKQGFIDQTAILLEKKKWDLIRLSRFAPFAEKMEAIIRTHFPEQADDFIKRRGRVKALQETNHAH